MLVLALETATRIGSVALVSEAGVLAELSLGADRDHAKNLAPAVAKLLGGQPERLTGYALSVGPGSFTGLRIGLALLKGLAVVHPRPAARVSTLQVIAAGLAERHRGASHFLALLDARREEVFAALWTRDGAGLAAHTALPEAVYPKREVVARLRSVPGVMAGGEGAGLDFGSEVPWERGAVDTPQASVLGRLALPLLAAGEGVDPMEVELAYLQLSTAEEKLGASARPAGD